MTLRKRLHASALALGLTLSSLGAVAQQTPANDPARSMEFRPGLGDAARERVPGGRLVVIAYGAAILMIGGYVAFIARRAAKVDAEVRRLEDDLARRRPHAESDA